MFKPDWRHPWEFLLLALLLFALPAFEAPKNLLCVAYLATWLFNRYRARDFGGRWDVWDSVIAFWLASGYLIAPFAALHGDEWGGANDMLRFLSLAWLVKRSGYSTRQLILIPLLAAAGSLLPLAYGLWRLWVTHQNDFLELNSVGHFNHTAIYLAIACGGMLSFSAAWWKNLTTPQRVIAVTVALALGSGVLITTSRGATVALFLLAMALGAAWIRRSRRLGAALFIAPLLLGGAAYLAKIEVVKKQERNIESRHILSYRDGIWRAALDTWRHAPLFGIGINNYKQIDLDKLKRWRDAEGKPFDAADYYMAPHAHSLYFGSLAERGLIGSAALLGALAYWLYSLLRHLPGRSSLDTEWALWGGALSAWMISVVVGLANTTLHHEHGILSMLMLGAWLALWGTRLKYPANDIHYNR